MHSPEQNATPMPGSREESAWPATTWRTARRLQNNHERPQCPQCPKVGPRQRVGMPCRRCQSDSAQQWSDPQAGPSGTVDSCASPSIVAAAAIPLTNRRSRVVDCLTLPTRRRVISYEAVTALARLWHIPYRIRRAAVSINPAMAQAVRAISSRSALLCAGPRMNEVHRLGTSYLGQRTSKPRATLAPDLEVRALLSGACRARSWCGDCRILARIFRSPRCNGLRTGGHNMLEPRHRMAHRRELRHQARFLVRN